MGSTCVNSIHIQSDGGLILQAIKNYWNHRRFASAGSAVALTLALGAIAGCGGGTADTSSQVSTVGRTQTVFGPGRTLGNGTVRAFITRVNGLPTQVGCEFTEGARDNLPVFHETPSGDAFETLLTLPPGTADDTAFQGLSLFESPGHPPEGNQSVQHWHLDAYIISQADRMALSPGLTFDPTVPADNLPPGHINVFVFVRQQGYIYIDPTIEMWYGHPFSTTGYAFYFAQGKMTTMEISAADAFLISKKNSEFDIPQPHTYPKPGFYPTHGSITYDATRKVYTFTMDRFVKR